MSDAYGYSQSEGKGGSLPTSHYEQLLEGIVALLEAGRRSAARSVNSILTTTYWSIGERLVKHEQGGAERAAYGAEVLKRLSRDLGLRVGRGFSERNLEQMRQFYLQWPNSQTLSADSSQAADHEIPQTASAKSVSLAPPVFPLPGRTMCACCRCQIRGQNDITRLKHCAADGPSGNWTVKSPRSPMSACAGCRAGKSPLPKSARRIRKSKIPLSWSFSA